ncbi:Rmf/CrpP family protein [Methylobacterium sp. Leaf117]|uniref:ribosome modulation factor n=1 Tax=Methylobacterium sp. Leaf117 TaxID=1736260 RepID=UPI000B18775D|nr:Rmf/CrpP family protein [Methylobacterium sp. Leaf117]
MSELPKPHVDPIDQGAQARAHGRKRECCPYPAGSEKREAWLEGFTGMPRDRPRDLPLN